MAASRPAWESEGNERRARVYEHHAARRWLSSEAKRGLAPQAERQVIDWNGLSPATRASCDGVGVSRPRIGR